SSGRNSTHPPERPLMRKSSGNSPRRSPSPNPAPSQFPPNCTHMSTPSQSPTSVLEQREPRVLRYVEALREAVIQEMERDSKVFLFGLDVDDHKGIQGSTVGLQELFGPQRVFNTPLSEEAMTGVAIGAAMAG